MVFFTCNHCGDAVKKPAVEKHYQTKCRGAPVFVSCIDCLKDFRDDEYVAHTKCITELQKYSGKDFVQKEPKNSGQKKQESWTEILRSILDQQNEFNLKPAVRGVFQRLQSFDNVPRKKLKFQNFIQNCMRLRQDVAESVWEVLENALEKFHATRYYPGDPGVAASENGVNIKNKKESENSQTDREKTDELSDIKQDDNENSKGHKKQKDEEPHEQPQPKKKKKNKSSPDQAAEECKTPLSVTEENHLPRKKKDKISVKNGVHQEEEIMIPQTEGNDNVALTKKKKKKHAENVDIIEPENDVADHPPAKKQKKISEEAPPLPAVKNHQNGNTTFDWNETIFNILTKYDNELSVDNLKRKVLKKYKKIHPIIENENKVQKTFDKKLKKSGLIISDNIVKVK